MPELDELFEQPGDVCLASLLAEVGFQMTQQRFFFFFGRLVVFLRKRSGDLINFCRRLPVTLIADDVNLGRITTAGLITSNHKNVAFAATKVAGIQHLPISFRQQRCCPRRTHLETEHPT